MRNGTIKKSFLVLCGLLIFAASGCAGPTFRVHPAMGSRVQEMKTVGLFPPDIKIYEFTAGGIHDLRDDWSEQGKENVQRAIMERFSGGPVAVRTLTTDKELENDVKEVFALYEAVGASIMLHTYNEQNIFLDKKNSFDYSVGSIEALLRKSGADALLLVQGIDEISTGGRQALTTLGILAGAFTGVYVGPRVGATALRVALVDSSGAILWFNVKGSGGGSDLRNRDSATAFVRATLAEFPGLGK